MSASDNTHAYTVKVHLAVNIYYFTSNTEVEKKQYSKNKLKKLFSNIKV